MVAPTEVGSTDPNGEWVVEGEGGSRHRSQPELLNLLYSQDPQLERVAGSLKTL
jgi:hypothetical protein